MSNPFFRFNATVLPYLTIFFAALYLFFRTNMILWVISVVISAWLSAFLLKVIFRKLRPEGHPVRTIFPAETKYSFPSEHATIFAALGIAGYFVNHIFGIILLFIAILIGIGRAGVGVHYKRDIVAGWALGVIIALVFIHFIHLI